MNANGSIEHGLRQATLHRDTEALSDLPSVGSKNVKANHLVLRNDSSTVYKLHGGDQRKDMTPMPVTQREVNQDHSHTFRFPTANTMHTLSRIHRNTANSGATSNSHILWNDSDDLQEADLVLGSTQNVLQGSEEVVEYLEAVTTAGTISQHLKTEHPALEARPARTSSHGLAHIELNYKHAPLILDLPLNLYPSMQPCHLQRDVALPKIAIGLYKHTLVSPKICPLAQHVAAGKKLTSILSAP